MKYQRKRSFNVNKMLKATSHNGFTLIEVMIALMIFAVTAVTISDVSSANVDNYLHLRDKTLASMVAENKLAEVRLSNFDSLGTKKDTVEFADIEWYVETKTTQVGMEAIKDFFRSVEVKVAKADDKEAFLINIMSYSGNY